jgi:hypothetical protein
VGSRSEQIITFFHESQDIREEALQRLPHHQEAGGLACDLQESSSQAAAGLIFANPEPKHTYGTSTWS